MSKLYLGNQQIGSVYIGNSFHGRMEMYEDPYVKNPYTWDAVISNCSNGKYASVYKIGDTIPLDLGSEGIVNMEIVGINADELSDGSGTAPLTWISKEVLGTSKRMNATLVKNYLYPEAASWKETSTNIWTTQNDYCSGTTASATWVITATTEGTLTISYKTSSVSYNKLTLSVNGTEIVTDWTGTSYTDYTMACTENDIIIVSAYFTTNSNVNSRTGNVKFASTGTFTISADVANSQIRVLESLSEGTGSIGGWPKTEMRTYMNGTVKNLIPENVRAGIKTVNKTYYGYKNNGTSDGVSFRDVCADDCWIPSYREIFGKTTYETSGPIYSNVFNDEETRKKMEHNSTSVSDWWLRSANNVGFFLGVHTDGNCVSGQVANLWGVALGFCT